MDLGVLRLELTNYLGATAAEGSQAAGFCKGLFPFHKSSAESQPVRDGADVIFLC